ncbi:MAG TPA: hypothetical protein VLM42_21180 [Bryobacteraceae bacterium]|nr:hypothetical protein [Bryobacteraceae bacterium]
MHRNLTPGLWNKFLGRMLGGALLIAGACMAIAQDTSGLSSYQGPGVVNLGAGDVGMRSGEQVNLRYYAGVSGIVDTNLQPFELDAHGNLLRIHNLYGVDVNGGAYGVHHWKRSQLGLDYSGDYRRYVNSNTYNGSDQRLTLGYTTELSRRWSLDLRESAGTVSIATDQQASAPSNDANSVFSPTTLLFDARTTFLQSSAYATYLQSARTSFTFGGSGFLSDQKSMGLSNSGGYTFTGSMQHRMSKNTTVGATYSYSHNEFPAFQSISDSNSYEGTFATTLGQFWIFSLQAGFTSSDVSMQLSFALNPVLAALFGQSIITENAYTHTVYPSGTATLERKFRRADLRFNYSRELNSGNGAAGTARQESATMTFSYTGVRKVNIGVSGGHYNLVAIGQNTGTFATYNGSAGFTYTLGHGISLSARYDLNQLQIALGNYERTSTRATLGLLFSPGNVPLALW